MDSITVEPLTVERRDDFLSFFDVDAFSDNPEWAGCYCGFFHFADPDWGQRRAAENRAFAEASIKSGMMRGYIAYEDGKPIGWVSANDRKAYARLDSMSLPEGESVLSVVCFLVSPQRRGQGVAARLLAAAIAGAKGQYNCVEAYPHKGTSTAAHCFHGPLSMYEKAGFAVVREEQAYWVVRRQLE